MTDLNFIHLEAKDIKKAIEALKKNGVGQNGCQVVLDANMVYQIMLENERLRRKPDPDTGIMRCGCGGDAVRNGMSFFCAYVTSCPECGTLAWSKASQQEADNNWNTAMGWLPPLLEANE